MSSQKLVCITLGWRLGGQLGARLDGFVFCGWDVVARETAQASHTVARASAPIQTHRPAPAPLNPLIGIISINDYANLVQPLKDAVSSSGVVRPLEMCTNWLGLIGSELDQPI